MGFWTYRTSTTRDCRHFSYKCVWRFEGMVRKEKSEQEEEVQFYPWEEILNEAGFETQTEENSERVAQISLNCPFHDDNLPSLSINLDNGKWICYANCGAGTLDLFISRYTGWSRLQTDVFIRKFSDNVEFKLHDTWNVIEEEDALLEEVNIEYKKGEVPNWIFNREFTAKTLIDAEAGTNGRGGLVLPIRDNRGVTVGSVTRQPSGLHPKYLYSFGLKKSKIVYGLYNVNESSFVCLTEGILDTLWLKQHNFESIAILGASMSKKQESLINTLHTSELVLCLDNDETGIAASQRIASKLSKHRLVSFARLPDGYKDIQEIRDATLLHSIIANRTDLGLEGSLKW
jgi:hypothetical protein